MDVSLEKRRGWVVGYFEMSATQRRELDAGLLAAGSFAAGAFAAGAFAAGLFACAREFRPEA
jgi:hypothetical protein